MSKKAPTLTAGDLLTAKEAAALLNVSTRCLELWRYRHKGPPFIQAERARPRYLRSDLVAFVYANRTVPTDNQ
jgi:hypothetical protein